MASKVVPLIWYCKTPAGWKRLPVAMSGDGKIRPTHAQIGQKGSCRYIWGLDRRSTYTRKP